MKIIASLLGVAQLCDVSVNWNLQTAKYLYGSTNTRVLQVTVSQRNHDLKLRGDDWTGFVSLTRKNCGADFLEKLADGTVTFEFLDKGHYYTYVDSFDLSDAGPRSKAVLRFNKKEGGMKDRDDKGNNAKDIFYMVVHGLDGVENMEHKEDCFTRFKLGIVEGDYTGDMQCVAESAPQY